MVEDEKTTVPCPSNKCGYPHAKEQPACYRCEKCGGVVNQDEDPETQAYPFFRCAMCGHTMFWD